FTTFLGKATNKDFARFVGVHNNLISGGLPVLPPKYAVNTFAENPEHTLIVYGTRGDAAANREAAEDLRKRIRDARSNVTVPMESDEHVTEDDLKTNHVILIGRPTTNAVAEKWANKVFPVEFGSSSFVLNKDLYAHPGSAVIAAAVNPLAAKYSFVLV